MISWGNLPVAGIVQKQLPQLLLRRSSTTDLGILLYCCVRIRSRDPSIHREVRPFAVSR